MTLLGVLSLFDESHIILGVFTTKFSWSDSVSRGRVFERDGKDRGLPVYNQVFVKY